MITRFRLELGSGLRRALQRLGYLVFVVLPLLSHGQSPFALRIQTRTVTASNAVVELTLTVPAKHLIYADTFKVSGRALTLPEALTKADPIEPENEVQVYTASFLSRWEVAPLTDTTTLTVEYQGCDDTTCFMPESYTYHLNPASGVFELISDDEPSATSADAYDWTAGLQVTTGGGYMNAREFLSFLDRAEGLQTAEESATGLSGFLRDPVAFLERYGLVLTLILVLLGGVLLNLTPCILPMIPINLAILGAGAGTRWRGFGLGSAYGAGIVLIYGGLGWLILRSGLFFGALQASPWFSLTVAIIFAVLALALFDVFMIDLTRFMQQSDGQSKGGIVAAFSAGALSALLAGACVAPVVLAVLLLAGELYSGGQSGAQFLPFVLGLGMALPWPFAAMGLAVLPKPGAWMVRIKQAFGVMLVILALYYFYLAIVGFMPARAVARDDALSPGDVVAWEAQVAQARRENKPIFIDFWATWCKNCSVMEHKTFQNEQVKARLANYVVIKVQTESPATSPAKEMLGAFDIRGLPGFVVLR